MEAEKGGEEEEDSSDEETRDHLMEVDQDQDRKYLHYVSSTVFSFWGRQKKRKYI